MAPRRKALQARSDKKLADLTFAVAAMNARNRLGIGFRNAPSED